MLTDNISDISNVNTEDMIAIKKEEIIIDRIDVTRHDQIHSGRH